MMTKFTIALSLFVALSLGLTDPVCARESVKVFHKTVKVGEIDVFYRESGPKDAPVVLLLHGLSDQFADVPQFDSCTR